MKIQLTIIVIFLSLNMSFGQEDPFEYGQRMRILIKEGSDLKTEPNQSCESLLRLPFWTEVRTAFIPHKSTEATSDTINEIPGVWKLAQYLGTVGYIFDGFAIAIDTNVNKEKNYRILIEGGICGYPNYDPTLFWYGVYRTDKTDSLIRVEINIEKPLTIEQEDFILTTNRSYKQESIVLIGSSVPLKEKVANYYFGDEGNTNYLYPGQRKNIFCNDGSLSSSKNKNFDLFATGTATGIEYHNPVFENYGLHLTNKHIHNWDEESILINQDISKSFDAFFGGCLPHVEWFGDLDGDSMPDILFSTWYGTTSSRLTLLLSSGAAEGEFLKKVDDWMIYNCY